MKSEVREKWLKLIKDQQKINPDNCSLNSSYGVENVYDGRKIIIKNTCELRSNKKPDKLSTAKEEKTKHESGELRYKNQTAK